LHRFGVLDWAHFNQAFSYRNGYRYPRAESENWKTVSGHL